ncbi:MULTISPECIES: cytochrome c1 [Sphingomonadales]|uniref:Cytochrome c1 n=1 Tax=Edaphosphingomonas haloaromaticamans TaxID=653954 RepID=A0A1S1HJ26_9SPHN|nr:MULTISPECIES: cytochrome c1 [Sphingomonas]AGH48134.1 cytochrome c1 [Sphingomonas sp. MM-1]MDX3884450.1 cytochrome c1 [Sphingomonas sp.]OHT20530.1 Cytochrome b/c1 [Sphingomonas haloaromaticamans]
MVRPIGALVGLGFAFVLLFSLVVGAVNFIKEPPAATAEHEFHLHPKPLALASNGPLGRFDRQQLQRGFQVYKEVCAACHSLKYVSFRDLHEIGFTEAEVKAIAKQWAIEVPSVNPDTGEPATRKAEAADKFPTPYPNEVAARAANNNALPPDLSLMTKARHDGAAYVHSLLTGYQDQPAELLKKFPDSKTGTGLHYNPYFANLNIAMPPPLVADGQVTYADGTPATVDQMAQDVSAFLVWTAEPKLESRHRTGVAVVIFLLIATGLAFMAYRNVWSGIKH